MASKTQTAGNTTMLRWSVIVAIALVAFFGSYRFAIARGNAAQAFPVAQAAVAGTPAQGTAAVPAAAGGSCCGSSGSAAAGAAGAAASGGAAAGGCCGAPTKQGPAVTKKATVSGNVQKVSVDLSKGYYDPETIQLKAGVPAEITFGQASGCLAQVQSQELGFYEDLQNGPVTVKIAALTAGTYTFTCGMQMQSGTIVVK